jgi:hypothetical protein
VIEEAKVTPSQGFGAMAQVEVKVNGQWKKLFSFFDDELSFRAEEFVGKTEEEGTNLFYYKDGTYLRS